MLNINRSQKLNINHSLSHKVHSLSSVKTHTHTITFFVTLYLTVCLHSVVIFMRTEV
jgi:hypothetical protein